VVVLLVQQQGWLLQATLALCHLETRLLHLLCCVMWSLSPFALQQSWWIAAGCCQLPAVHPGQALLQLPKNQQQRQQWHPPLAVRCR
jgi:hypothetical protein